MANKLILSLFTFLATTVSTVSFAQLTPQIKEYDIRLEVAGAQQGDTVYLANYFGKQLYYFDTTQVQKGGKFAFKGKRDMYKGQYAIVFPRSRYFELLVAEPNISLKTDTADFVGKMEVIESEENKLFFDYINYLGSKREEVAPIREEYDNAKKDKVKEELRQKMIDLDKAVKDYQRQFYETNKNRLAGQIVGMALEIEVPDPPKKADGSIDSTFSYYYYRDHYFELCDFKNEAIVRSPAYHNKLEYFFDKVVLQHPDTICKVLDNLVADMDPTGDLFKYTVNYIINKYNKSKIMGMDAVFVNIADSYYLNGKAYWADSASVAKIKDRVDNLRPTLIGKKAPKMVLFDTTEKRIIDLYNVKADYTVLFFWDPNCGHCKKAIPIMKEAYEKLKSKGVEVFAVCTELENADWKKFVKEKELNWINVSDTPEYPQGFRTTYDIFATPKLFVLDKDKKIIAKQIGAEQLEEIMEKLMKRNAS